MDEGTNKVFHSKGNPSQTGPDIKMEVGYRHQNESRVVQDLIDKISAKRDEVLKANIDKQPTKVVQKIEKELKALEKEGRKIHISINGPRNPRNPWDKVPVARGNIDSPSDEFLNDYIPQDLDTFVTWRNVLACGMIPEQRNNKHIREDIQYDNIQINYPESPSPAPAPAPAPESSLVVEAHGIEVISCTIENDSIEIVYINERKYIKKISKDDELWKNEYSKYFQNDFHKFYNILEKCFTDKDFYVKWNVKDKTNNIVIIQVYFEDDLFGFKVDISIEREENSVDILEKKVKELENKYDDTIVDLQNKVNSLCEIINMMGPSFMRNICGDEKKHGAYGTNCFGEMTNVKGTGAVPIDPTDYIDQLSLNSKTTPTGGIWTSKNGRMQIISENGLPTNPDGLSWSQAAWNVVKSQKNLDL